MVPDKLLKEHRLPQTTRAYGPSPSEMEALAFLLPLSEDYPGRDRWYFEKVLPGVRAGTRVILRVERDNQLVGLGIAKDEGGEKKICTVRVAPHFAGRGTGVRIFDGLLKWLDVDQPHLSVNESKLPLFERIFEYYKFSCTSEVEGLYVPSKVELGYNELRPHAALKHSALIGRRFGRRP